MSTEGNDLKGRGRRLFSALRRSEESPAAPDPAIPTESEITQGSADEANPGGSPGSTEAVEPTDEEAEMSTTDVSEAGTTESEPERDSWTSEPGVPTTGFEPEPPEAPGTLPAADSAAAAVGDGPAAEPAAAGGTVTPILARTNEPHALLPAEGGHVEPPSRGPEPENASAAKLEAVPATAPGSTRPRAGAGPLPGSSERSKSVGEAGSDTSDDDTGPEPYDLPRVIAIANQKGGVGKTTTSVNLGASLAELDYRVLVVDLDPQGNATTGLGINARNLQSSVYDVIMSNAAIEDCVEPTSLKNLFVAPATIDLAGAEIELVPAFSRELKLRRALEEVRDEYDYVLIDCPPSLGLLTVNGLAAADDVIVPIQCEYYALEGLSQLIRNVTLVRTNLNPKLDVRGIVLTMYDARTKLADQVEQEVRGHFGRRVYQTVVPRTVRLSEAPSFGQPIIVFDSTSRGAIAYRELAKEVSSGATRRSG
jgi:chromosome partitioning protein